jgi:hypothetical protein
MTQYAAVALISAAALAAAQPSHTAPAPSVAIPLSARTPDTFSVILRGARPLWGPVADRDDRAAITAASGILAWPSGILRHHPGLPGVSDIVVAQHDPRTIWVVAHFTGPIILPRLRATPVGVYLTFRGNAPPLRISARWAGVPLAQAARDIQRATGVPIAVRASPETPITLAVSGATLDDLADLLAAAAGGEAIPSGGGYAIVPRP